MTFTVYLAGQIHDDWRQEFIDKSKQADLDLNFVAPETDHDLSDNIGVKVLGEEEDPVAKDEKASDINNFRTSLLMSKADLVVAFFGEEYKQWNTAMDATTAITQNKPLIIVRDKSLHHGLKELANKANVVVENFDQAVQVLDYATK